MTINNGGFFSERKIKKLLKEKAIFPSKKYGQHFLIKKGVMKKIIKIAVLKPNDFILEIGPGMGNLTIELAKRVKKVIAIEKDKRMVEILKEVLKNFKNVKIIQGDILKIKIPELKIKNSYKIVANLPYYLTGPVIRKFLAEVQFKPKEMILLIQKEVAQKICSRSKTNLLALSVQLYAQAKIISFVQKESFWPRPKVDGAIIKIFNIKKSKISSSLFFKIVRAGFSHPRKKILNNLSQELKLDKERVKEWLLKNKIGPHWRPENLKIEKWLSLTKTFPEPK